MQQDVISDEDISLQPFHPVDEEKMISRSDIAQEIISRKPDFMERWALLFFLAILISLLISTWFIRYPDIVESRAILSADNAPKEIISLQEGRLVKLFVNNDDHIETGEVIGWIESTADHREVIQLSRQLDSTIRLLSNNNLKNITSGFFTQHYEHLGELQTTYQQYIAAWQQFNDYLVNGFFERKKVSLQQDVITLNQMNQTISKQKGIAEQDMALADSSLKMTDMLLNEKIISKEEYRNEKSKFLSKQTTLPQLNAAQLLNLNQQREKRKEIEQLEHDIIQQKLTFEQALNSLQNAVMEWMRRYTLRSPIAGKVAFITPLQQNKYLQQGVLLGYVLPDTSHYYAEMVLPQNNFGKVTVGQRVQLRLDAFPYAEFGFVEGKIGYISKVPSDSGFLAIVNVNKNLTTSYRKKLPFKNGLRAQAIIITRDMRLLQRMYYTIVKDVSVSRGN